jgi:hypothetical protein
MMKKNIEVTLQAIFIHAEIIAPKKPQPKRAAFRG